MAPSFDDVKLAALEKRKTELVEEYQAASGQLTRVLSAPEELRIKRQIDHLEAEIKKVEQQIRPLRPEPTPEAPIPPQERQAKKDPSHHVSLADVLTISMENGGHPLQLDGGGQTWARLVAESKALVGDCQAIIADVQRLRDPNDVQGEPLAEFQTSILSWAPSEFGPLAVQAGDPKPLDLVWRAIHEPPFPDDEMRIASASEPGRRSASEWGRSQDFIPLKPGHYLLVVRILATGYASLERRFRLHWPGPGQESGIRLFELDTDTQIENAEPKHTTIRELARQVAGKINWLWLAYLTWLAVSAVSLSADLAALFDLAPCSRFALFASVAGLGGLVILAVSLLPRYTGRYKNWDRGLTLVLLVATVGILGWLTYSSCWPAPAQHRTASPSPTAGNSELALVGHHANVVLVVDTSGSMAEGRLDAIKAALHSFVDETRRPDESVGLVPFSSSAYVAVPLAILDKNRAALLEAVDAPQAGGETALIDAVATAHSLLQARGDPASTNAIIVMTDGKDNSSHTSLGELRARIEQGNQAGVPVVVYAIAYGDDADVPTLSVLADATGGSSYRATPDTIEQLYRAIASRF